MEIAQALSINTFQLQDVIVDSEGVSTYTTSGICSGHRKATAFIYT